MHPRLSRLTLVLLFSATAFAGEGPDPATEALAGVRAYRQAHAAEIVNELVSFLRLPNDATNVADIARNAEELKKMLERRGIRTEVLPTDGGRPVVFGELRAAGADTTVLFYCHYDGQAVDPSHWHSQPYEPVLRAGYPQGPGADWSTVPFPADGRFQDDWRLFARSVADDKSPIVGLLAALDALHAQGLKPRVNLKFFFEGEEEQGSPHLARFIAQHKQKLAADLLIIADGPVHQSGRPTVFFGARGIMTLDLTAYGPTEHLHSGHYGNWAPNPAFRLAELLASMKDRQGRVTIAGYYDNVVPLTASERRALAEIPPIEPSLQQRYGIGEPDGAGKSLQELINLPSLNIRGLHSGWVGADARTIVPRTATAAIDVRLVKGTEFQRMYEKIMDHIRRQGWHVVEREPTQEELVSNARVIKVVRLDGYNSRRTPKNLPIAQRLIRTVERATQGAVVKMPTLGGSGPLSYFEELGIPSVGVPIVNFDNNQHGPNENLRLGHFFQGIEILASILLWE